MKDKLVYVKDIWNQSTLSLLWPVIVTVVTCCIFIRNETKSECREIRNEVAVIRSEIAVQSARTDKLYEMFIDLLKEIKNHER